MPCCYESDPLTNEKWCKNLETVYTDAKGKEYCVFHAPQGKKRVSLEAFNNLVFDRIKKAKEQHEACDLSGTIFKGDIAFSQFNKANPLPDMDFSNVRFNGEADFTEAQFNGRAHFLNVRFRRKAYFIGVHFNDYAVFNRNQFSREANFIDAQFDIYAGFEHTHFTRKVDFRAAHFKKNASFENAQFSGGTSFKNARFTGKANFQNARFNKDTDFEDVCFENDAYFMDASFDTTYFMAARFSKEGGFIDTWFNGFVDFEYLHIEEKSRLTFRNFITTNTFLNKASFKHLNIEGLLLFEGVDLSGVSFSDTQIQKIDFVNVRWRRSGWGAWRNTLYDELDLFKRIPSVSMQVGATVQGEERPKKLYTDFEDWMERTFFYAEEFSNDIRKVEILYRRMKDKYRNLQNWPEVSNWHYGEKEMYRKENAFRRYFPFSFSFLYWLSSGYGERYVRAGVVLGVLIVILSLGLAWTGLDAAGISGSTPSDFHGITSITRETLGLKSFGALLMNTLKYSTFQKDIFFVPRNMWGEIVRFLAQILIPIQAALFILAVRNRFRR